MVDKSDTSNEKILEKLNLCLIKLFLPTTVTNFNFAILTQGRKFRKPGSRRGVKGRTLSVPHPDVFWAYHFLYIVALEYHSRTKEGEVVRVSPNTSIFDAFGDAHLYLFLFLNDSYID